MAQEAPHKSKLLSQSEVNLINLVTRHRKQMGRTIFKWDNFY